MGEQTPHPAQHEKSQWSFRFQCWVSSSSCLLSNSRYGFRLTYLCIPHCRYFKRPPKTNQGGPEFKSKFPPGLLPVFPWDHLAQKIDCWYWCSLFCHSDANLTEVLRTFTLARGGYQHQLNKDITSYKELSNKSASHPPKINGRHYRG